MLPHVDSSQYPAKGESTRTPAGAAMPSLAARPLVGRPLLARVPGLFAQVRHTLSRVRRRLIWPLPPATVIHVTHHKAGSQWVRRILEELSEPWVVSRDPTGQFSRTLSARNAFIRPSTSRASNSERQASCRFAAVRRDSRSPRHPGLRLLQSQSESRVVRFVHYECRRC